MRIDRAEVVVAESQRHQRARLPSFDQHIGGTSQLAQFICAALRFEIDDQRLFVGVEVEVLIRALGAGLVIDEGRLMAGADASGRLDQRYLCAEVGEQACGERGAVVGEVEHADAVEGE